MFKAFKVENHDDSVHSKASPSDPIVQLVDNNTKSTSYARVAGASTKESPRVISNFRPLLDDSVFDSFNIYIPRKAVEKVSTRFEHTLYGYFIGKRMAFPVVEYYVRNNWAKHGLKRITMNNKGFFFFKINSHAGLEAVLEGGPWMIHNSPIILKKWSMDTRLLKEELTRVLIWSSFARCLIEVNSKTDLVDVVTIGVPSLTGDDFTKETIHVEYEWRPPRCYLCKIFGHVHDDCPKSVMSPPIVTTSNVVTPTVVKTNDGFQTAIPSAPKKGATYVGNASKSSIMSKTTSNSSKNDNIITSNSYSALNEEEHKQEDFENVYDETANLFLNTKTSGSSSFTAAAG
uniref:DUF4283 domain-containing protein n=1 Tax=Tanacetum cinerariifolium TaxID=118510 RepID=A0A6L2MLP5_TANCI|nr:hypothetical protein [Tanacetum cinerariifolium]